MRRLPVVQPLPRRKIMFESILSTIKSAVAGYVRAVERAVRKRPWVAPTAILGFFFLL
jgi:hypothetical protein